MTSREKFEKWWGGPRVQESFAERTFRNIAWDAWQASRDEEIELPDGITTAQAIELGYAGDYAAGRDGGIEDCQKLIIAAGFKVKGG